jgi:hypothetical protein
MELQFHSNEDGNVRKMTLIENKPIYMMDFMGCIQYIATFKEYLAFENSNIVHIFHLLNDGIFTDEFKIEMRDKIEPNKNLKYVFENTNVEFVSSNNCFEREQHINLEYAKRQLEWMNDKLQMASQNLKLHLDYIFDFEEGSVIETFHAKWEPTFLLLCLFRENHCISSLTLNVYTNNRNSSTLTMDSKTNKLDERKGYNTLLRAVAIIISKHLDERIYQIESEAINAISAYTMICKFNAIAQNVYEGEETIDYCSLSKSKEKRMEELTNQINENMNFYSMGLITYLELTDANVDNAKRIFEEWIDKTKAVINGGLKKRARKKSKIKFTPKSKAKSKQKTRKA